MNYKETDLNRIRDLDVGQVAAIYAARRSSIYSFQTGAAIVRDGRVVEIGWSHVGAIRWKETPWSTHAEAHAIRRANFNLENCDLYIATLSKKGNLTLGCPCEACGELISNLKNPPNTIVYTAPDSSWWTSEVSIQDFNCVRERWEAEQ